MSYREKYFKYKYKYLKEKKDNKKSSSNRKKIPKNKVANVSQETFNKMSTLKYKTKEKILNPDTVKNEKDFIDFLRDLYKEKKKDDDDIKTNGKYNPILSSGKYGWQNHSIYGFLEAMTAGYEDKIEGNEYDNIWTKIANIIYLGKIYE